MAYTYSREDPQRYPPSRSVRGKRDWRCGASCCPAYRAGYSYLSDSATPAPPTLISRPFFSYHYDRFGNRTALSQTIQKTPDAVQVYDALGNRVAEKVNDVWQFVIYDAFGKLVAEYGGSNPQDEGGVKYYLQDWQGSVRAGVNAGGYVKSRTDHQAFGEDIASGVGLRTTTQGYGAPATNRQGYGLTEKDSATGLNHTWFRKNENRAGRWTSPDPYNGSTSVGDPQSWNRYSYVDGKGWWEISADLLQANYDALPLFRLAHTTTIYRLI